MKGPLILLLLSTLTLQAGPRTSANYSIVTDVVDAAGKRASSASYTNDGSTGGAAGISTVASPGETMKHGYVGQLTEVTGLQVISASTTLNEGATLQLGGSVQLDDLTTFAMAGSSLSWTAGAPLSIGASTGLVTGGIVYQDTLGTAQTSYAGFNASLDLTVLDTIPDNYPGYAGDGIGDGWQVQYFGQPPNANAGPLLDPDHDGFTNAFEFTAGLDPTNALSVFNWRIESVIGQPTQKKLIFSPRLVDRSYTVKTSPTLGVGASWTPLTGSVSDSGNERTVIDASATGGEKFYSVQIQKP